MCLRRRRAGDARRLVGGRCRCRRSCRDGDLPGLLGIGLPVAHAQGHGHVRSGGRGRPLHGAAIQAHALRGAREAARQRRAFRVGGLQGVAVGAAHLCLRRRRAGDARRLVGGRRWCRRGRGRGGWRRRDGADHQRDVLRGARALGVCHGEHQRPAARFGLRPGDETACGDVHAFGLCAQGVGDGVAVGIAGLHLVAQTLAFLARGRQHVADDGRAVAAVADLQRVALAGNQPRAVGGREGDGVCTGQARLRPGDEAAGCVHAHTGGRLGKGVGDGVAACVIRVAGVRGVAVGLARLACQRRLAVKARRARQRLARLPFGRGRAGDGGGRAGFLALVVQGTDAVVPGLSDAHAFIQPSAVARGGLPQPLPGALRQGGAVDGVAVCTDIAPDKLHLAGLGAGAQVRQTDGLRGHAGRTKGVHIDIAAMRAMRAVGGKHTHFHGVTQAAVRHWNIHVDERRGAPGAASKKGGVGDAPGLA